MQTSAGSTPVPGTVLLSIKKSGLMKKVFIVILFIRLMLFSQSIDSLISEIGSQSYQQQLETLTSELWAYRSNNPTYAIQCGQHGIELATKLDNKSELAELYNLMGIVYRNIANYTKALEFYNHALRMAESVKDSVQIAYSYNNIGGAYRLERNYTIALTNMYKALEIFEKLDVKEGIAFCTINIGMVYRYQGNHEKAIDYFDRTIKLREKLGDKFGLAVAINQVIEVYFNQGKLDVALKQYDELYKLYEELGDIKGIAVVLSGIGAIQYKNKNYPEARENRERALVINRSIENNEGIVNNLNELALIYLKLGNNELANKTMAEATKVSKKPGYTSFLINNYLYKSRFFEETGSLDSALFYFKKYKVIEDSLASLENVASIASMEAIYQVDLASKENKILMNENKLKNEQATFLLILAVLLITLLSFGIFRYYANKNLNQELSKLNATKDKFFSIVAHDLKNPFINLLGYTDLLATGYEEMSEEERKQSVINLHNSSKKMLALVENLLQWSSANIGSLQYNPRDINIKQEVDEIIYLYSESIKQKNLHIDIEIEPELKVFIDKDYFNLVMRNLTSNAIKFSPTDGKIMIDAEVKNNYILVSVKDFGVGMDDEKISQLFELGSQKSTMGTMNESGTGLGLILARDLVKKWGGDIMVKSQVDVGSTFTISIPKK